MQPQVDKKKTFGHMLFDNLLTRINQVRHILHNHMLTS